MALYDGKRLQRSRHALATLALFAVPVVLMGLIFAFRLAFGHDSLTRSVSVNGGVVTPEADLLLLAQLFGNLHLRVVTFVAAAVVFSNLYHSEIAERTLHHVFLMPVRREIVTVGKYIAGVARVSVAAVVAWWASAALLMASHGLAAGARGLLGQDGLEHLASTAATLVLAVMAYGALFLLLGSLLRAPSEPRGTEPSMPSAGRPQSPGPA